MKFREYDNVEPKVIVSSMTSLLESKIKQCEEKYDIIDLQFSTHYDPIWKRDCYCALLLVKGK